MTFRATCIYRYQYKAIVLQALGIEARYPRVNLCNVSEVIT